MKPVLEHIPIDQQQSIFAFHYAKQDFETPWHFHPQHELTYIEESVGTKFIGDYVGDYVPGELVLLRSNLPHCWKNYSLEDRLSRSTVIQWNTGIFQNVPELKGVFSLLKKAAKGIHFHQDDTREIIPLVKRMPTLEKTEQYLLLLSILNQLNNCRYTTLSQSSFFIDLPREYNKRMARVHEFIGLHYHRKIKLRELASLLNISDQSFSRFFSKMMGRPFSTYLNEYRINIASRLLIDTDKSVAEIAFACGYESLPFFHKQFNKFKVDSPAKFRKKHLP